MKITKYIFNFSAAVSKTAKKMGLPPLSDADIFTLYAVNHAPLNCSRQAVHRWAQRCFHPISINSIGDSALKLRRAELLTEVDGRLAITPMGREFIARVRLYLLRKRIR